MTALPDPDAAAKIGDLAAEAGIRRIHVLAWRDLDDVEAGGSELHAANVCREWAAAGLEVHLRTSFAQGHPPDVVRDGYVVRRKAGRYLIFPRAVAAELAGRDGQRDALVEIWNGMPFFSPLWARGPRVTFLHHVHGEMWHMVLPPRLARAGDLLERRVAPLLYRRSRIVTLSASSKAEIVDRMGLRPERIDVVPPGIDDAFRPGPDGPAADDAPVPTVLVVGRLVPSKHVDRVVRAVADARRALGEVRLEVVGEGYERHVVEAAVDDVDGGAWVELAGRVDAEDLLARYRRAWVLASASSHEGWGMSVTEAAACGTPAVVTDVAGHRDAVAHERSGLLVPGDERGAPVGPGPDPLGVELTRVLGDPALRARLSAGALAHAAGFGWGATATRLMGVLADDARRRR